jgi:uncharacterized protein YjbI with pentapeptide repeats
LSRDFPKLSGADLTKANMSEADFASAKLGVTAFRRDESSDYG